MVLNLVLVNLNLQLFRSYGKSRVNESVAKQRTRNLDAHK